MLLPRASQYAELALLPCCHSPRRHPSPFLVSRYRFTVSESNSIGVSLSNAVERLSTGIVPSLRASQMLHETLSCNSSNRVPYLETDLSILLLLAVSKKCGSRGLTLTHPIFCSLRPYHLGRAAVLSSRRSRCVIPPSESETHISWPETGRSIDVMSESGA